MMKRKGILNDIRKDKKVSRKEIGRTVAAAKDLEVLIDKLVEAERVRKEREAAAARESNLPPTPKLPVSGKPFDERRGQMRWPVGQGKIVARFGNQQHPILHTITQNTGIDISVPTGSSVEAIADGDVSLISWLPSFGNLVILDHSNGYRTVYAHLSEILVKEG